MSNSVDQRVVEMQFDNSNFNKNVQGTLDSLKKLDKGMELKNGGKGLNQIQEATKKINFSPIHDGLSLLGKGFGAVGSAAVNTFTGVVDQIANVGKVATMTVAGLTAAVGGLAVSGGIKRALNLEHANFQLQGLLKSDEAVKQVMDDVNKAVTGTAYGLDEAAVVASQLAASNVKASESGGEMLNVLQAIAGTAAMGGRSFADVGNIFATVAGQGKLMTMQLRQMESMGINAAATMTQYGDLAGHTEEEIREMVTKGEVDFATFSKAMSEAFGEHAQKANETFTGAMSNVKAALSRIGAEFAIPSIENLRKIFVALIPVINSVKTGLAPVVDMFKKFTGGATDELVKFLKKLNDFYHVGDGIGKVATNVAKFFSGLTSLGGFAGDIFGDQLTKLENWWIVFSNIGSGLGSIAHEIGDLLKSLGTDLGFFFKPLNESDTISSKIMNLAASFGQFAKSLHIDKAHSDAIRSVFTTLLGFGKSVGTILGGAFKGVANILGPAIEFLWSKLPAAAEGFKTFADGISQAIGPAESIAGVLENLGSLIGSVFKEMTAGNSPLEYLSSGKFAQTAQSMGLGVLADGIGGIAKALSGLKGDGGSFFESLSKGLSSLTGKEVSITGVADAVSQLLDFLSHLGTGVLDTVANGFSKIGDVLGKVKDGIKDFLGGSTLKDIAGLGVALGGIFASFKIGKLSDMLAKGIEDPFTKLRDAVVGPITNTLDGIGQALQTWQNSLKADTLLKIAAAIGVIALSLALLAGIDSEGLAKAVAVISIVGAVLMGITQSLLASTELSTAGSGLKGFIANLSSFRAQMQQMAMLGAIGNLVLKFAAAILVLAISIKMLSSLKPEELITGLAGLAAAMLLMVGAMALLSTIEGGTKGMGKTMLGIAAAVMILAVSLKLLSTIPMENMESVFVSLVGTFAILLTVMAAMNKMGDVKGVGALLLMAGAILVLTPALMALSLLPMQNIAQMLVALGGALAIMAVAAYALSDAKVLAGAAALLVLSAAVLVLAPALLLLSSLGFEGTAVAIVALAAAFAVLGVAGYLIEPVVPALFGLAGAIALFGVGVLAAGVGVAAFAAGLAALAAGGTAGILILVEGFKLLLETVLTMLPQLVAAVANSIVDMLVAIGSRAPELIQVVVNLGTAMIQGLITLVPQFVQLGVTLLTSLLQGLRSVAGELVTTGVYLILLLAAGIAAAVPALVEIGMQGIISLVTGLASSIRSHHQEMYDAGKDLFMAILEAMGDIFMNLANDIGSFIMDIPAYISGEKQLFSDAGKDVGESTAQSAEDSLKDLPKVGEEAVGDMLTGMSDKFNDSSGIADGFGASLEESIGQIDMASIGSGKVEELAQSFSDSSGMQTAGKQQGDSAVQGLDSGLQPMGQTASSKVGDAVNKMKSKKGEAKSGGHEVGSEFGSGISAGMQSWIGPIADKAAEMVRNAKNRAKAEQNSASPSKDMMKVGGWFGEGYAIGIANSVGAVANAASDMVRGAKKEVTGLGPMSLLTDGIDWDSRPVISPVLDLTDYQAGLAMMQAMNMSRPMMSAQVTAGAIGRSGSESIINSGNSKAINVQIELNYGGSEDADQLVMDIARGLESKLMMEGV